MTHLEPALRDADPRRHPDLGRICRSRLRRLVSNRCHPVPALVPALGLRGRARPDAGRAILSRASRSRRLCAASPRRRGPVRSGAARRAARRAARFLRPLGALRPFGDRRRPRLRPAPVAGGPRDPRGRVGGARARLRRGRSGLDAAAAPRRSGGAARALPQDGRVTLEQPTRQDVDGCQSRPRSPHRDPRPRVRRSHRYGALRRAHGRDQLRFLGAAARRAFRRIAPASPPAQCRASEPALSTNFLSQ